MKKTLFLITLLYFALGFVNIIFALFALLCMALPLIILFKTKKKVWCNSYCPRASLFNLTKKVKPFSKKTPRFFVKGKMKWIMLGYFIIALFISIFSTIMVANGKPPMETLRFLLFIPLPKIPQLISISAPDFVVHFAYRFYSMMLTTTILGLILAFIYKPRTWCVICPIATVSDLYLNKKS